MKLRRFNEAGISAFRDELAQLRANPERDPNLQLIEHRGLTEVVTPETPIEVNYLRTKGEAAHYLQAVLGKQRPEVLAPDAGLWTWLTCLFIDSVCPPINGRRSVKNDYFYVFEPRNSRHSYRHLLNVSWQILQLAPRHNTIFMRTRLDSLDGVTTEVMKRLFLTRIPCIFEVLERLYWDDVKRRPRSGISGNRPSAGNLRHRLPLRISQLEKTYDLMSVNADQLIELLGDEFSCARPRNATLFDESVY
jgi:hypothetical protein